MDYFPYYALGYRCNPFRVATDEEWAALAILPDLIEAALDSQTPLQILGDKGHGKTTALLALAARFRSQGCRVAYEHIEIGHDRFVTDLSQLDVFLVDEAQRLTSDERERLLKPYGSLRPVGFPQYVIASHEDLTPLFSKAGQPLTTVRLDDIPLTQLTAILARRLDFFARPAATQVRLAPDAVRWLHATYGADIRLVEQALYEVFEGLKGLREIQEIGVGEIERFSGGGPG